MQWSCARDDEAILPKIASKLCHAPSYQTTVSKLGKHRLKGCPTSCIQQSCHLKKSSLNPFFLHENAAAHLRACEPWKYYLEQHLIAEGRFQGDANNTASTVTLQAETPTNNCGRETNCNQGGRGVGGGGGGGGWV
jgi:hypothetical protein